MIRIDAHQHFWSLDRGDYDWLSPELTALYRDFGPDDLRPLMDENGITGSIAVQAAATVAETRFLLSLADADPRILGVVGWIDFAAPDAATQLSAMAQHPRLSGIRPMLQDLPHDDWILHPANAATLDALASHGLVFDALIRPRHIPHIVTLATRYPTLSIVVDHAAKPAIGDHDRFIGWTQGMSALAGHANIACKLSGLLTEAPAGAIADQISPYVETVLAAFGPNRVIWGSDWPVMLLAGDYSAWSHMADDLLVGLGRAEQAAIRGGNARRIYNLSSKD